MTIDKILAGLSALGISVAGGAGVFTLLAATSYALAIVAAVAVTVIALPLNVAIFSNAFNHQRDVARLPEQPEQEQRKLQLSKVLASVNCAIQQSGVVVGAYFGLVLFGVSAKAALAIGGTVAVLGAPICFLFNHIGIKRYLGVAPALNEDTVALADTLSEEATFNAKIGWWFGVGLSTTSSLSAVLLLLSAAASIGESLADATGFTVGLTVGGALSLALFQTQFIIAIKTVRDSFQSFAGQSFSQGIIASCECQQQMYQELTAISNALAVAAQSYLGMRALDTVLHTNSPLVILVAPLSVGGLTLIGVYKLSKQFISPPLQRPAEPQQGDANARDDDDVEPAARAGSSAMALQLRSAQRTQNEVPAVVAMAVAQPVTILRQAMRTEAVTVEFPEGVVGAGDNSASTPDSSRQVVTYRSLP